MPLASFRKRICWLACVIACLASSTTASLDINYNRKLLQSSWQSELRLKMLLDSVFG